VAAAAREKWCQDGPTLAEWSRLGPHAKTPECPRTEVLETTGQSKSAGGDAKGKTASSPPPVGEGCKSNLMTLVENGVSWAKGCKVGQNQWRFWCSDGRLYDEAHPCAKGTPSIQAAEGEGCISSLMLLVEKGEPWGKGCSIGAKSMGTNQWRFWCSNGRVYEETQPSPPPPGALGRLCDPKVAVASRDATPAGQVPGQGVKAGQAVSAAPDQLAVSQCLQQILSRNQCQSFLTVTDVRQVNGPGQTSSALAATVLAEIDMESIQEFEVRSDTASNCTGTWWKKEFSFQKNDFGWRCLIDSMKPVEDAVLTNRPQ
jgi:hypothetical protein